MEQESPPESTKSSHQQVTALLGGLNASEAVASLQAAAEEGIDDSQFESSEFLGKCDALRGYDCSEMQPFMDKLGVKMANKLRECSARIADEGMAEVIWVVLTNAKAINVYAKTFTDKVMTTLVERLVAVHTAYSTYSATTSKANANAFNKAILQWKENKLATLEQSELQVNMVRSCIEGLKPALASHIGLQTSKLDEANKDLRSCIADYKKIAYGCRDGTS
jgi:hypothetical protein